MLNNQRILIIRLSSIGDVLHATPVAKALKESYPTCHITWIVSTMSASLLLNNPYIDKVYVWSREEFDQAVKKRQLGTIRKLWHQLKLFYQKNQFDIVLDVHGLFLSGMIAAYSKAPRRIGMANTRELNRFFMTEQAPPTASRHVINRYLSVLAPLHIHTNDVQMTLNLNAEQHKFADDFMKNHRIDSEEKLLLINFKTTWTGKNWGNENFARLIDLLAPDIQILLCGSKQDKEDANKIISLCHKPIFDAAGKTSLLELAALIHRADLVLTGDTGTLHMAIALQTPTISLWGASTPEQYGPIDQTNHIVIRSTHSCLACHKTKCAKGTDECMKAIPVETVAEKVNAILK